MSPDEYVLDTPVVREFVAGVRETIAASGSPAEACDAIRPRFAALLADAELAARRATRRATRRAGWAAASASGCCSAPATAR